MKKPSRLVLAVALCIAVSAAVFFYLKSREKETNGRIKVSGNIEAQDVRIAFRVQGKIAELLADEGTLVKKGMAVARLETDELVRIRDQAKATLTASQAQYVLDKADAERAANLFQAGAISAQRRDLAVSKSEADKADTEALKASLDLAETRLGFAELQSPIDGYILVKSAEAGEVVQPGSTVFTAADLQDIWLTAYVNETDLAKVKLNQAAEIKIDTYPDKAYKGRISFISQEAEFTPKQIQTNEERVKLVYRIKIRVDNPELELKPGMPADAYIIE